MGHSRQTVSSRDRLEFHASSTRSLVGHFQTRNIKSLPLQTRTNSPQGLSTILGNRGSPSSLYTQRGKMNTFAWTSSSRLISGTQDTSQSGYPSDRDFLKTHRSAKSTAALGTASKGL